MLEDGPRRFWPDAASRSMAEMASLSWSRSSRKSARILFTSIPRSVTTRRLSPEDQRRRGTLAHRSLQLSLFLSALTGPQAMDELMLEVVRRAMSVAAEALGRLKPHENGL